MNKYCAHHRSIEHYSVQICHPPISPSTTKTWSMVIQLILYSGKQMLCCQCLTLKVSFRICIVQGLASAFKEIKNRCPDSPQRVKEHNLFLSICLADKSHLFVKPTALPLAFPCWCLSLLQPPASVPIPRFRSFAVYAHT